MPKRAKELTATAVDRLKAEGSKNRRIMVGPSDCAGLHLRIEGGTKSWALRIKVGDKRRDIGLGAYNAKAGVTDAEAAKLPGLSLAEARAKARELRAMAQETGTVISPTVAKTEAAKAQVHAALLEAAKAKTFRECAEAFIETKRAEWKNEKHGKQWLATLEAYAFPKFGKLPVASIDRAMVLDVLRPIWSTKTETASRLRGRIESILDWATVSGYREGENPARWRGHLDKLLPAPSKVKKVMHHAALPYAEAGEFMVELRKREGMAAKALEFAILCASRSGEVRGATWAEIDLKARLWVIPAHRMKAGKEHRIPLSDAAVKLLEGLTRVKGSPYVFPAPRGGALTDSALTAVLKRMGRDDLTQHGFRSTFRDWAGETTSYPREVIEHALAHQLKDKAEAAYQRGDLLAKRKRLMADWAKFCDTVQKPQGNVVAINEAVA